MAVKAQYVADLTIPDDTSIPAAHVFEKVWRVRNNGDVAWGGAGYALVFTEGTPMSAHQSYPVPVTAVNQTADLSLTLTAPTDAGTYTSYWRLQNNQGQFFGPRLFVRIIVPVPEPPEEPPPPWEFTPERWRETIWAITSIFETGKVAGNPAAYQTYDAGIISYGKHQATLQSGTLLRVLAAYYERSSSAVSLAIQQEYGLRLAQRDATLRHEVRLRELLIAAAAEPAMVEAQDAVFDQNFYQPAIQLAQQYNLISPLALACIYDAKIQGGVFTLLPQTRDQLGGIVGETGPDGPLNETRWLATFLDLREARLLRLAAAAEARGEVVNAKALRISTFRVQEYRQLLQVGNLALAGDLTIRGRKVPGIVKPL